MSLSISISLRDTATPALRRKLAALTPQRLGAAVGPAVADLVRRHFRALPPNKRRFPTTHFWPRAAEATSWQAASDGVLIRINQTGVRQRYYGGPIRPVNRKMLAYPIAAESYGKTTADFGPLKFIVTEQDGPCLGFPGARGSTPAPLFALRKGVDQWPDHSVLPSNKEISDTATRAIHDVIS